jgi:hypothetical protein
MTRGDVLRDSIAFALRRARKIIRGLKEGLTEDERYAVAEHVVSQLKRAATLGVWARKRRLAAATQRQT